MKKLPLKFSRFYITARFRKFCVSSRSRHVHVLVSLPLFTCLVPSLVSKNLTDTQKQKGVFSPFSLLCFSPTVVSRTLTNIVHSHLIRPLEACEERLKSGRPFVPAGRKLCNGLVKIEQTSGVPGV